MKSQFDHEKLRAYQEGLRFIAWADPILESLPAKLSARDQLERASTSIVLNIAEGNGKRSHPDRCRYFDIARGSIVECAACLDVLVVKRKIDPALAASGKDILVGAVSMVAGLIARFSESEVHEAVSGYGAPPSIRENEND
jgi:four helix bundle protein